jgi:hypothetical protein
VRIGVWRAFVAAADADEVVRIAAADLEKRRRADMMLASRFLLSRGLIAPDALQRTADVFGFLTAPASYLYFVEDSGWSRAEYEAWLRSAIMRLVVGVRNLPPGHGAECAPSERRVSTRAGVVASAS